MSCSRTFEFCVNHSFLLDSKTPKNFDINFVEKIKSIKPQLELFLGYYEKYSETSVTEFRKRDHKIYIKDFVDKLSQALNLSCEISFNTLSNFLAVDGKMDIEHVESILTRGYDTVSLIKAIVKYYRQERLSLIRLMRYVFCNRKDEWQIIAKIIVSVSKHEDKLKLFNKILTCYKTVVDDMGKSRSCADHWEDTVDDDSFLQSIEEQVALLETLLLAAHDLKTHRSPETFTNVLLVIQANAGISEARISRVMVSKTERIGLLQGLLLVETAGLETLFGDEESVRGHFLGQGDTMALLCESTRRFGTRPCDGVAMLLASLLWSTFPIKIANHGDIGKMAEVAITKLGLFKYLRGILTSQPYSITPAHCSHLELVLHCTLFDLLSFMCHNVHINSLESSLRHELVSVMSELVRPINLYSNVKFLKSGFLKMLEDLSLSFPVNLDMLMVVSSLMDRSHCVVVGERMVGHSDVVSMLSRFLDNLSWFCDGRSAENTCVAIDDGGGGGDDDDNERTGKCARPCRLTSQYRPYCTTSTILTLEQGQPGFILDDTVVWAVHYSAWHVVSAEIELTCMLLSNQPAHGHSSSSIASLSEQFMRLETILDFLTTCAKSQVNRTVTVSLFCDLWRFIDDERFLVEGCEGCLVRLIDLASQILSWSNDHSVVTTIVGVKNLFPHSHPSSQKMICNDSIVAKAWQRPSSSTNIALVQAYLRFSLTLIGAEKFLIGDDGIIPPSLIFGSIVFISSNLLVDLANLSLPNPADMADLAANGLVILNEILSLEPSFYAELSANRRSRLALIRSMTLDIIGHNAAIVRTLLAMSSLDVECLLAQTNVSSHMLAIEGTDQRLSQVVLMALTIVKFMFDDDDNNNEDEDGTVSSGGAKAILDILNSTINDGDRSSLVKSHSRKGRTVTYTHQYVLSLLELLGYSYGAKIARMGLIVLRLVVQHTNVSIVACLGEKTATIKDLLLKFVGSRDQDQMIRALVFDFIGESVMGGRHGLLQLICQSDGNGDGISERPCLGYQSCLDVISSFQPEDSVSSLLLVAVSKFLLIVWMNDCQSIMSLPPSCSLWSSLLSALIVCIDNIVSNHNSLNLVFIDFIGNIFGLLSMELYSSLSTTHIDDDLMLITTINEIISKHIIISFLDIFQQTILDSQCSRQEIYLEKIVTATTWWKAFLLTVMSLPAQSAITWLSVSDENTLIHKMLGAVSNLLSIHWTDQSTMVIDLTNNIVSCVLMIIDKRVESLSGPQTDGIIERIVCLLTSMLAHSSVQTHCYHADLLASCSVILLKTSVTSHKLLHQTSSLAERFIQLLTLRSSLSHLDSQTLVHAITVFMATNKDDHTSPSWTTNLASSGILINCVSLLYDRVKSGHLSSLTQTILTLLIQVSTTALGAHRMVQSYVVRVMETDVCLCHKDEDIVAYLTLMAQLILTVLQHAPGQCANIIALRFVSAHWERLEQLVNETVLVCMSVCSGVLESVMDYETMSKTLSMATNLFDLLWHLVSIRSIWIQYWSPSMIGAIMNLVVTCINTMIAILNEPHTLFAPNAAHIFRNTSSRLLMKHVSFSLNSPRKKCPSTVFDESTLAIVGTQLELSSARLEAIVYRLLHSGLMVYARSTYLTSEEHIYSGWEYSGTLLSCDFGERRLDGCHTSLSFGCLFSLLGSTQSLVRDNLPPLIIGTEQVCLDGALIRQTHELVLGILVSHATSYLSKHVSQSHRTTRNNFILNMKTELNCYLDGLSKSRRRSALSSSSPLSHGPRVTSTPYAVKSPSVVGLSLDVFCGAVDSFKKSLDYF